MPSVNTRSLELSGGSVSPPPTLTLAEQKSNLLSGWPTDFTESLSKVGAWGRGL